MVHVRRLTVLALAGLVALAPACRRHRRHRAPGRVHAPTVAATRCWDVRFVTGVRAPERVLTLPAAPPGAADGAALARVVEGPDGATLTFLGPSGAVPVTRAPGPIGPVSVARGATRMVFAWSDHRNGDTALQAITTDLQGRDAGDVQRLSIRFVEGAVASVVAAGEGFGVAWSEPVGGAVPRSYLALLDARGRRVGSAMRVATEDNVALTNPALWYDSRSGFTLAMARAGGGVEVRRTGPRGCDMPLE